MNSPPHNSEYELLTVFAEEAAATLYLAFRRDQRRTVLVRTLRAEAVKDPLWSGRFQAEGELGQALTHPNIVRVLDVGMADGLPFQVLQYAEGESLEERAQRGTCAPTEVIGIATQIASALDDAHSRGIGHGNLCPADVLLGEGGEVRVKNFSVGPKRGNRPPWIGMNEFAAPERGAGGATAISAADLYSLGLILYRLLAGRLPPADADAVPPSLGRLGLKRFDGFFQRALSRDPALRYRTGADLSRALTAANSSSGRSEDIPTKRAARPRPTVEQLESSAAKSETSPPDKAVIPKRRTRPATPLLLIAILAVAVGSGAAFLQWRERTPTPAAPGPTITPLPLPSGLAQVLTTHHATHLRWNSASGANGIEIERQPGDAKNARKRVSLRGTASEFIDRGLHADTEYVYRVSLKPTPKSSPIATISIQTRPEQTLTRRWKEIQARLDDFGERWIRRYGPRSNANMETSFRQELDRLDEEVRAMQAEVGQWQRLDPSAAHRRIEGYCLRELGISDCYRGELPSARMLLRQARGIIPRDRNTRDWLTWLDQG